MKDFIKQIVKNNKRRSTGFGTGLFIGLGVVSAVGIAFTMLLTPKSKKIITSTIQKDQKKAVDQFADKSDDVKNIIIQGYNNINRELQNVGKKISNEVN